MNTYAGVSFPKPQVSSPGAAAAKEPNTTIIAVDDVLAWPVRDSKGVKELGSYVLKPNARMYSFYSTPSKFKASTESDGDEDAISIKQKIEAEAPGDSLELNEFLHAWTGVNCIIIFGSCSDQFRKSYGTKCAPLQLKPSTQDDNDARKATLVFEQMAKSKFRPGHYTGAVSYAPAYAAAGVAFAINAANGNYYQLPALTVTAAIAPTAVDLEHGQIVTLIGGGGVAPATLTQGTAGAAEVLLTNGSTWQGLANAVINLQVFIAGDESVYLIEVSRG